MFENQSEKEEINPVKWINRLSNFAFCFLWHCSVFYETKLKTSCCICSGWDAVPSSGGNTPLLLQRINSTTAVQAGVSVCVCEVCVRCSVSSHWVENYWFGENSHDFPSSFTLPLWPPPPRCFVFVRLCRNRAGRPRMSVTRRHESEPWRASPSRNRSALSATGPLPWSWRASRSARWCRYVVWLTCSVSCWIFPRDKAFTSLFKAERFHFSPLLCFSN